MTCTRCGYGPLDKGDPPRKKCPACFLRLDPTVRRREHVRKLLDQPLPGFGDRLFEDETVPA